MYMILCVIDIKINKVKKRRIGKGATIRKKEKNNAQNYLRKRKPDKKYSNPQELKISL